MDTEDFQNTDDGFEFQAKGEWCFLCKNITSSAGAGHGFTHQDHSPYLRSAVKILVSYLLNPSSSSCEEDIQSEILSSFQNGKCSICAVCLCRARNLLELHLELEKIQMQILDDLKYLQDYLRSSVPVLWKDDDVVFSRFQDVLQKEFFRREFSDGAQVPLEHLRRAGFKNTSSSSFQNFAEGDGGNIFGCQPRSSSSEEIPCGGGGGYGCDNEEYFPDGSGGGGSGSTDQSQEAISMEDVKPLVLDLHEIELQSVEVQVEAGATPNIFGGRLGSTSRSQERFNDDDGRGRQGVLPMLFQVKADEGDDVVVGHQGSDPELESDDVEVEAEAPDSFGGHGRRTNLNENCDDDNDNDEQEHSVTRVTSDNDSQLQALLLLKVEGDDDDFAVVVGHHDRDINQESYSGSNDVDVEADSPEIFGGRRTSRDLKSCTPEFSGISSDRQVTMLLKVKGDDDDENVVAGHHDDDDDDNQASVLKSNDVEAEADPDIFGGRSSNRSRDQESCDNDSDYGAEEHEEQAISSDHDGHDHEEWLPSDDDDDDDQDQDKLDEEDNDDKPRHSMAKRPRRTLRKPGHSMTTRRKGKVVEKTPTKVLRRHMRSHRSHHDDHDDDLSDDDDDDVQMTPCRKRSSWECDICLENIPFSEMESHLRSHPEFEKIYKCSLCPQQRRIYGSYKGLVWHYLRVKHGGKLPLKLPCLLCPTQAEEQSILYKKADLCKHLYEIHHPTHKKLPCKKEGCPQEFYNPLLRNFHFHQEHSSLNKCDDCGKTFKKKQDLQYHLKSHHKDSEDEDTEPQLRCRSCPKVFKSELGLRNHEKTHQEGYVPDKAQCPECSQMILKTNLRKHLRVMHSENVNGGWLTCDICKARVKTPNRMKLHMKKIHEEGKTFQCSYCPKQFRKRESLRFHEKAMHVENEMVQCPQCPTKKMFLKFLLAGHIYRVHREKKKEENIPEGGYRCPESGCPYKGSTKNALQCHLRLHKKRTIRCQFQFCKEMFATKRSLELHERTHTTEKTCRCDLCPEAFYSKYQRYAHKKKVHDGRDRHPVQLRRRRETVGEKLGL